LTDIDPKLSKDTAKIIAMAFIGVALIAAQIAVTVASGGADAAEEIEGDVEMVESETSTATDATSTATDATADATDDAASTTESQASDEQQEVQQQARNLYAKYDSLQPMLLSPSAKVSPLEWRVLPIPGRQGPGRHRGLQEVCQIPRDHHREQSAGCPCHHQYVECRCRNRRQCDQQRNPDRSSDFRAHGTSGLIFKVRARV
jgi:hypothetical protein